MKRNLPETSGRESASPAAATCPSENQERANSPEERVLFQRLAALACVVFGVAMIANSHLACDGGWYWYAYLHHAGKHLYSDMHLPLQPLAVLETEAWTSLAGCGWIVSKFPAVLHLIFFTLGIALVAGSSAWTDLQKAILILFTFFIGIHFEAFRFDDYHVISHACYLLSIYFLLRLGKQEEFRSSLAIAVVLGILSAVTVTTRLTDGLVLAFATEIAILALAGSRRIALSASFGLAGLITVVVVIGLTGDSLRDYVHYTILGAARIKGGASQVGFTPLLLLKNAAVFLTDPAWAITTFLAVMASVAWALLVQPFSLQHRTISSVSAAVGACIIAGSLLCFSRTMTADDVIIILSASGVLMAYCLAALVVWRMARNILNGSHNAQNRPQEVILLLPFALLVAGSMSSGGYHYGLYAPIAFLVLVLPSAFPAAFRVRKLNSALLALMTAMAFAGAYTKFQNPLSWHGFRSFPMFSNRLLIRHPTYGPMIISNDLYRFIEPICARVKTVPDPQLLSIPFPYANYYCDVPPWEGFVQSFFDTSGKEVIDTMIDKLRQSPPQWILYQRQLANLKSHEIIFNAGQPLPHRDLDVFLMQKLAAGEWQVENHQKYGAGNEWYLIKAK